MDRNLSTYTRGTIKYRVDTAIQVAMFDASKKYRDEPELVSIIHNALLDAQTYLYEEFEIDE